MVILRNNVPRYVEIDIGQLDDAAAFDEDVCPAGQMFIDKHRAAFEELAK